MMSNIFADTLRGAAMGSVIGGGLCFMSSMMKQRQSSANETGKELGISCVWLKADPQLCEIVSRYKELVTDDSQTQQLYKTIVESCDALIKIVHDDVRPTRQIHANRALVAAKASAMSLCRIAASKGSERAHELRRDIEQLESLCNNHLHNIMLG